MGKRWFHVTAAVHDAHVGKMKHRHGLQKRGALSVVSNLAGDEYFIKVAGADKTWRKKQTWMKDILGIYDEGDHYKAVAMVKGPLWEDPDVVDV